MSGITTGSRLEQLQALQRRIHHEIQIELRKAPGPKAPAKKPRKQEGPNVVQQRLAELGVTTRTVKEWGITQGLITEIKRGRIGITLVDAYAAAHASSQEAAS